MVLNAQNSSDTGNAETSPSSATILERDPTKERLAALHFWQAIEYLSPQAPPKADEDNLVWSVTSRTLERELPWNDSRKKQLISAKKWENHRFQVFAGTVPGKAYVEEARQYLGAGEIDLSEQMPPSTASCVVVGVGADGVATGQVFVSTLPWAMSRLKDHIGKGGPISFEGFFGLEGREELLRTKITDLLISRKLLKADNASELDEENQSSDSEVNKISRDDIIAITDLVFNDFGWRPMAQADWRVKSVRAPKDTGKQKGGRDDPLNSFYVDDIERVIGALRCGDVGAGLTEYLRGEDSSGRMDVEHNISSVINAVLPAKAPLACWPAAHPLVLAQQFAVNTAIRELSEANGIFSVNGPPGTGKTTMLKDLIAAIVTNRADKLAALNDPMAAYGGTIGIEDYQYGKAYRLIPSLRGHGIVVTSANNGAVENVTKELPGIAAVSEKFEIDYFSAVSDSVATDDKAKRRLPTRQTWGLMAAVLGNMANRSDFATRFWFGAKPKRDAENKQGHLPSKDKVPPEVLDHLRFRTLKDVVLSGDHGALPWPEAKRLFEEARGQVNLIASAATNLVDAFSTKRSAESSIETIEHKIAELRPILPHLLIEAERTGALVVDANHRLSEARSRLIKQKALASQTAEVVRLAQLSNTWRAKLPDGEAEEARKSLKSAIKQHAEMRAEHLDHQKRKPRILAEIFRTQSSKRWNKEDQDIIDAIRKLRSEEETAAQRVAEVDSLELEIKKTTENHKHASQKQLQLRDECLEVGIEEIDNEDRLASIVREAEAEFGKFNKESLRAKLEYERVVQSLGIFEFELEKSRKSLLTSLNVIGNAGLTEKEFASWNLASLERDEMHRASPYEHAALFTARRNLFVAAMELHKSFIVATWSKLGNTLGAFVNFLSGGIQPGQISDGVMALWDAFFMVVPVVSTTFASFPRLFNGVGREDLAWLLIDEAGQATPQQAVGAIWRSKRSIIVGDPLQLEPVTSLPRELISPLLDWYSAEKQWVPPIASAQTLADRANRYGTYFGDADNRIWVGAPLVVHRRCLNPMFGIANSVAYEGKMVYGTGLDKEVEGIGDSRWIDTPADEASGHWVEEQGQMALQLVQQITGGHLRDNDRKFKVYIVTPFRSVAWKIKEMLFERYRTASNGMSGTVHTFQGKEAEHVIFLLGGDPKYPGVIAKYAGAKPNLVNVAVTRAKRRLYVIGDRSFWTGSGDIRGIFNRMANLLPVELGIVDKQTIVEDLRDIPTWATFPPEWVNAIE